MDMGDILNQWDDYKANQARKQRESGKNQVSRKKANAPTPQEKARALEKDFEAKMRLDNEKSINPMELWLRRYGTVDKDKLAEQAELRSRETDRSYLISMPPEATLDLHGLHQDEAYERLGNFISDCKRRGLKKVLIVHGKGIHTRGSDPVLGELVRKFIERDKRCGTSGHPKGRQGGGTGATWVLLR